MTCNPVRRRARLGTALAALPLGVGTIAAAAPATAAQPAGSYRPTTEVLLSTGEGQMIRLPIPDLTEERRKELAKLAGQYAEKACNRP